MSPTIFLNTVIENFVAPPGFMNEAKKSSFGTALHRALWGSYYARMIEEEIYSILGKHDYHIEDGEINFKNRSCWFSMYFTADEKIIDLDSVHFQLNDGGGALVTVERTIDEIYYNDEDKLDDAESRALEILQSEFDALHDNFHFHDPIEENELTMELRIDEENVSYLPKLKELNDVMNKIEYVVRDSLK